MPIVLQPVCQRGAEGAMAVNAVSRATAPFAVFATDEERIKQLNLLRKT